MSFNDARTQLVETNPEVAEKVVVFAWSFPIPERRLRRVDRTARGSACRITAAFLDIASTDEGAQILFDTYEIDGSCRRTSTYDMMGDLMKRLAELSEA